MTITKTLHIFKKEKGLFLFFPKFWNIVDIGFALTDKEVEQKENKNYNYRDIYIGKFLVHFGKAVFKSQKFEVFFHLGTPLN